MSYVSPRVPPEGIAEALLASRPGRMGFTERGRKSLSDRGTDSGVRWNVPHDLRTVAHDLYANRSGVGIAKGFRSRSKLEFARCAGSMTGRGGKSLPQHGDEHRGCELSCGARIKNETREACPEFIRVCFGFDTESGKIVVSSCGRRFDVFSTRAMR